VSPPETLGAFGQTALQGVGVDPSLIPSLISQGKVIGPALA
jgi:hypothetical protein